MTRILQLTKTTSTLSCLRQKTHIILSLKSLTERMGPVSHHVNTSVKSCAREAKGLQTHMFKGMVRSTDLFTSSSVILLVKQCGDPWWGFLVSTSRRKKKNIQADPRKAHTRSEANTLCHVRGLSHVLACFGPLMSSPECPGWYPHHPVGWLTPSNRKGLLPWPTMLTQKAEEEPWLSYITSCSPGTRWLYERWNPQERRFQSVATMNRTFTRCSDRPEESCEFCYSWEHSWNEIKLKTRRLLFKGFRRQPAII